MGRLTVQLPDTLHHELEARAQSEGVSLKQYVLYMLTQKSAPAYTIQVLSEEGIQQQRERFNQLLTRLGPPDRQVAEAFLTTREHDEGVDMETSALIAHIEAQFPAIPTSVHQSL